VISLVMEDVSRIHNDLDKFFSGAWPHSNLEPNNASFTGSFDWLIIGGIAWSYQPPESS